MPEEVFETPQPVQIAEQKTTNWPKIILAAVLGLALLAAAAYAGYCYGTQQVQQPEKPTPAVSQPTPKSTPTPRTTPTSEPAPTPTPVVEATPAGWEVYTNPWYSYSFAYPSTWSLIAPKAGAETTTLTSVREEFDVYPLHDFAIQSYGTGTEQNLTTLKESTRNWVWESGYPDTKTMLIGGENAWTLEGLMKFADDKLYWRVYSLLLHNNKMYEFSWWDTPQKLEQQTFDQILSTFKFLD